jgi:hypothetical protein
MHRNPFTRLVLFVSMPVIFLTRIFHELASRDREDGRATWQPQELGPEAYLTVRRRGRGPRTPGRTAISTVAVGDSLNIRVT